MFKDIDTVRYAPDYAFTYEVDNSSKIKDSVGISVIDLSIREELKDKQDSYIAMLTKNIDNYINQGKKVYLYSFCSPEGDERTMDILLDRFKSSPNITGIRFNGNLDEFLGTYTKMEYMICARFHAIILSSISKQKLYVMSYSKKIDNVITDLEMNVPIVHFNEITDSMNIDLLDFKMVEDDKITDIIKNAQNQERVVRNILNNN